MKLRYKEKNIKICFVKWRCFLALILFVVVVGAKEWSVSDKHVTSWITKIKEKMFNPSYVNPFSTTENYQYYAYNSPVSIIPTYQEHLPLIPSTITTKQPVYNFSKKVQSTTSLPIVFESSSKKLPAHQSDDSKHMFKAELQQSKVRFANPIDNKSYYHSETLRDLPRHTFCHNYFPCAKETYESTAFMETLYYPRHPYPQKPYKSSSFHTTRKTIKPLPKRPESPQKPQKTIVPTNSGSSVTYYIENYTTKSNFSPSYRQINILPFYLVYES